VRLLPQINNALLIIILASCVGDPQDRASLNSPPRAIFRERTVEYAGKQVDIFLFPGKPTKVIMPTRVMGSFKRKRSLHYYVDKENNNTLIYYALPTLPIEGEAGLYHCDNRLAYAINARRVQHENERDVIVYIVDGRLPGPELGAKGEQK